MPTLQYRDIYYPKYGISKYHEDGFFGAGVSIYVIDTGLTDDTLSNVKTRLDSATAHKTKKLHGSFVTTILAKSANPMDTSSVSGIAPEAEIFLADVTGPDGLIYTSYLTKAIQDAIQMKADIISVSLGTTVYDKGLEAVVNQAVKRGSLVIASSGNCSCRAYEYPAALESAISVASMDQWASPSAFNTRNDMVSVFAPGQSIDVPGAPTKLSGTSFATPFASGLLALEWSKRRLKEPNFRFTRDTAIEFLRQSLQNECSVHNYTNGHCAAIEARMRPSESNGLAAFLFLFVAGAAMGLLGAYLMDKTMEKPKRDLSGGFIGPNWVPGPLSWFGLI